MTTGRFRVNIAYRNSEFEKPVLREYKGVPAALGHITDPTIGSGRRCTRVTPESPIRENTGYGLLNWIERFGQVSVATVYSKTHWTKRVLSPTELLSALDAPALISKRASDSQKREWSQELNVPCKVRAEVMNLVCQSLNPTERRVSERDGPPEGSPGNTSDLPARKRARVIFNLDGELSITDAGARKNPQIDLEGNLMPSENKGSESEAKESRNEKEADETEKYRRREKACKSDNAAVPVYLWNDRVKAGLDYSILHNVSDEKLGAAFDTIRGFLLRYWKRKVVRDFDAWWEDQRKQDEKIGAFPDPRSFEAGKAAISHANAASWWDWDGGSALFFWRWPKKFQIEMRDGLPPRFVGQPPRSKERQRRHKDPEVKWKE